MALRQLCVLIVSWAAVAPAWAQEAGESAADEGPWSGKVSFGYLATTGNTENSNSKGNFEVGYATGDWEHVLDAYAINASENKETTAEAYGAGWLSRVSLTGDNFLFGRLNYRNDRFSGFPTQFSQSAGYGRRILKTAAHLLTAEIGAGARQSERADGAKEDDFIVNGRVNYKWTFSETANFTQDFVIEHGQDNTYLESVTAVRARLIGDLALVASYTVKNNSDVPVGSVETDTWSSLSLEYAF